MMVATHIDRIDMINRHDWKESAAIHLDLEMVIDNNDF